MAEQMMCTWPIQAAMAVYMPGPSHSHGARCSAFKPFMASLVPVGREIQSQSVLKHFHSSPPATFQGGGKKNGIEGTSGVAFT